jgi:iron-sulfur cluster repair protein YtfE (RIC family)
MPKATDRLLTDHKLIRKVLQDFRPDNPRFPQLLKTLHRAIAGHAWFEDEIFLPALRSEPRLERCFLDEISTEHRDLDHLLRRLKSVPPADGKALEPLLLQMRALLDAHFAKEEDALFPLAERYLDDRGLNDLAAEMERRKTEVRGLGND